MPLMLIKTYKDFIHPFQELLKASNGDKGKAEIKGKELNPESLEDIARSASSTGDDAAAVMQLAEQARPIRKRLRGNPLIVTQEDLSDEGQTKSLLQRIRQAYERVRNRDIN